MIFFSSVTLGSNTTVSLLCFGWFTFHSLLLLVIGCFVLQSMFYWLCCALFEICMSIFLVASESGRKRKEMIFFRVLGFCVPMANMVAVRIGPPLQPHPHLPLHFSLSLSSFSFLLLVVVFWLTHANVILPKAFILDHRVQVNVDARVSTNDHDVKSQLGYDTSSYTGFYPNQLWNEFKDPFTCTPQLRSMGQEYTLIYSHYMVGGFICITLISMTAARLYRILTLSKRDQQRSSSLMSLCFLGLTVTILFVVQMVLGERMSSCLVLDRFVWACIASHCIDVFDLYTLLSTCCVVLFIRFFLPHS
jgi:hypothetical protein